MEESGARLCAAEKLLLIGDFNRVFFLIFKAFTRDHRKIYRCDLFASPRNEDVDAEGHADDGVLS